MVRPRRCATCLYHRPGSSACTGCCTHPKRRPRTDVPILVRDNELACRTGWGRDLWEPSIADDMVVGLLTREPVAPERSLDDVSDDLLRQFFGLSEVQIPDAPSIDRMGDEPSDPVPPEPAAQLATSTPRPESQATLRLTRAMPTRPEQAAHAVRHCCRDGAAADVDEPGVPSDEDADLAGLPKTCHTCRDFVADAAGDGGWCGSAWAFATRHRVRADILSCQGSMGSWWLPHDDLWLTTADVARHDDPTPLLDRLRTAR